MISRPKPISRQTYGRGFEGLVVGETEISRIDGDIGKLWIRGYPIDELCKNADFEEVAYLVIHGELPNDSEYEDWCSELRAWRNPPEKAMQVLNQLPESAHPLMKYRSMLSVAACVMPEGENSRIDAQWNRPARILAWTAGLAAAAIRHMSGEEPLPPDPTLGFADNILWQSLGKVLPIKQRRAFEVSMIAQSEHSIHAAALAALVVISTGADLGSAVLAGMGALSGELHGGANQRAFEMFNSFEDADQAQKWAVEKVAQKYRFPGFGHRVYKVLDPRVKVMEPFVKELLTGSDSAYLWDNYLAIKDVVEEHLGSKGIHANVDAITGLLYHPLGLPVASFPIPFALAIQVGWMAHCLEYIPSGKLIEPAAIYVKGG